MKTRKFWLSLLTALLCAALLCPAIAVAAGEEVIVQLETEANSGKPAATGDLALELDPGIDAPIADISNVDIDSTALSLDIGLTTFEGEGNDTDAVFFANEETAGDEQTEQFRLKVIYSGPTLTKEYDLTRNCFKRTESGGYAYAITPPKTSDFTLVPKSNKAKEFYKKHKKVQVNVNSIKAVEQFSGADVGKYRLKFTFGLTGDDAQYYAANSVTIPARILRRTVEITPRAGVAKTYGTNDPVYPDGSWLSPDETSPLHQDISGVPGYGVPVNTIDGRLQLSVTNQEYLLAEAKLKGTKFFPNDGWLGRKPGEKVGKYKITIGNMNFGPNFKMILKDVYFKITAKNIADANVTVDAIPNQKHTGKAIKPDVTVRYGDMTLKKNRDYTVAYENNTDVSTTDKPAKVKLTGKGNFTGTKDVNFIIVKTSDDGGGSGGGSGGETDPRFTPKGTSLTRVTGGKRQISVNWERGRNITGYQIAFSTTKDFAIWEDRIVTDPERTSLIIDGLRSKKTYYVRIRTFRRLNGQEHYSDWSKAKKVTTK